MAQTHYFFIQRFENQDLLHGPIAKAEFIAFLKTKRLGLETWIYSPFISESKWLRVFEHPDFQSMLPPLPDVNVLKNFDHQINQAMQGQAKEADINFGDGEPTPQQPFYLLVTGSEFGPLTLDELKTILSKTTPKDLPFIWYKGLSSWFPIEDIRSLQQLLPEFGWIKKIERPQAFFKAMIHQEPRSDPRVPIVGSVSLINDSGNHSYLGVCLDLSQSGLQVLLENPDQDFCIGENRFKIVFSPLSVLGIRPFEADAEWVWKSERDHRAGMRFLNLSDSDRDCLIRAVESAKRMIRPK